MPGLDTLLGILALGRGPDPSSGAPGGVRVREYQIKNGDRGARQLVEVMKVEARAALRNPLTIHSAEAIIPARANAGTAVDSIRQWIMAKFVFSPDPHGVELLRTPDYLLSQAWGEGTARGDCDDVATLAAALVLASGNPARFQLISLGPGLPLSHVFCEAHTMCRGWVELDVTRPDQLPEGAGDRTETFEV